MTFPTHFSYICVIKQYIVCIFASGNSMNTTAQYKKVDHVVWICSVHSTSNLRPSLGVSVCSDAGVFVNHCWHCEEGRRPFALGQGVFVDHYFGSVMSMSALWWGETELTEGGGEEEAVGLGVSACHCLSLLLTSQPIHSCSAPKLCVPARAWPKRHENLLHVLVRFKNPYACKIISARKENKQFFCCVSSLENTLWCQILRPYCLHSVAGYSEWKRMQCEFVNRGAAGTLRGRE